MFFGGRITNAPHVPRARAFREAGALVRNPVAVFQRYRQEFGRTFTVHLGGAKAAIVSTDPSFIHHALQDTTRYHVSTVRVDRMAEFQGQGLINSHGAAWLKKRRFLSRSVRRDRLSDLLPCQEEVLARVYGDGCVTLLAGKSEGIVAQGLRRKWRTGFTFCLTLP